MVLTRSTEVWPIGQLDVSHYLSIHHHLFQDVYDWAGALRTVRIGKGGVWFCFPEYIEGEMNVLFGRLRNANYFHKLQAAEFSRSAARFLSDLNAIHPFREGNGRAQMSLLTILTDRSGLPFRFDELEPERAMNAMIDSFQGNLLPLEGLIRDLVRA